MRDKKMTRNEKINYKTFEILVRENHRMLIAYIYSLTLDNEVSLDIAQETFLTAYNNILKFDATKDFSKWLRGIAKNKYFKWRSKKKEIILDETIIDIIDTRYNDFTDFSHLNDTTILDLLNECLKELKGIGLKLINMFYKEKIKTKIISETTGISEPAVRKRLQRIRGLLGKCISKKIKNTKVYYEF